MPTPPPSGNALIEGVIPLFRMLDAAAAAEPLLMWLVWSMMATALAAVPVVVSRVPSPPVSLLLVVPAALLLVLELTTFLMLLGDLLPVAPLARVAMGLALSATILLVGWACAGALPRPMQSAEVTLRLARPMLIASVFLLALALHPFAPRAAIAVLVGVAVFTTEVLLARLLLGALRRGSTATSSADLRPFGCAAPVHVVPDGGLSTLAVAVGLTPGTSAVFLQQRVERALRSADAVAVRGAAHILAHEAGHIVQRHGLWAVAASSVLAAVLAATMRPDGMRSIVVMTGSVMVVWFATSALGEWAAERYARRVTGPA